MTPTTSNGDTPRTDAAKLLLPASNSPSEYVVDADFARQLERELADMTARCAELRTAGDAEAYWHERYVACKAERDELAAEAAKLRGAWVDWVEIAKRITKELFGPNPPKWISWGPEGDQTLIRIDAIEDCILQHAVRAERESQRAVERQIGGGK